MTRGQNKTREQLKPLVVYTVKGNEISQRDANAAGEVS